MIHIESVTTEPVVHQHRHQRLAADPLHQAAIVVADHHRLDLDALVRECQRNLFDVGRKRRAGRGISGAENIRACSTRPPAVPVIAARARCRLSDQVMLQPLGGGAGPNRHRWL